MVRSMDASLRFYTDGLGFTLKHKWTPDGHIRWCWLEHGGAALMLQEFRSDGKHAVTVPEKLGTGVGLNLVCEDALAFYHVMKERGIETKRPFVGNRMWVTSLHDFDGYSLHFESPTDVPEGTEYDQ